MRQTLEAHDAKIAELLQELKETNQQILLEQAKSQQVEELLDALTQTVGFFCRWYISYLVDNENKNQETWLFCCTSLQPVLYEVDFFLYSL